MSYKVVRLNLNEAIPLLAEIRNQLADRRNKRRQVATVFFQKGEVVEKSNEVDTLTDEINKLIKAAQVLQAKIARANLDNYVDFEVNSRKLTIAEAIDYNRELRRELMGLEDLARQPKQPVLLYHRVRVGESVYEIATFDVERYEKEAQRLRRFVNRLSMEIDRANFNTYIEIDVENEFDPREFIGE